MPTGKYERLSRSMDAEDDPAAMDAVFVGVRSSFTPILCSLSFVSYLCRCNMAFVSEDLRRSTGMSEMDFGASASIFFLSYVACQLPSNMVLARCGALTWLPCLAISW